MGKVSSLADSIKVATAKNNIKVVVRLIVGLTMVHHVVIWLIGKACLGQERALSLASERLGQLAGLRGMYVRQIFYRLALAKVGCDVHFGFGSLLSKPKACIGDRVYIGRRCVLGWVDLADDVMLADCVQVLSGRHQHGKGYNGVLLRDQPHEFEQVRIGQGAWIGAGAIILADVGEHAVVGAGAVVVKAVPAGMRVGGVPAKPLSVTSKKVDQIATR